MKACSGLFSAKQDLGGGGLLLLLCLALYREHSLLQRIYNPILETGKHNRGIDELKDMGGKSAVGHKGL